MPESREASGQVRGECALVVGAGIAGICAARVLSDHFARVLILERDQLAEQPEPRRGVPHGRHLHGLLAAGLRSIEALFPGFTDAAVQRGGHLVDVGTFATWYSDGVALPKVETGLTGLLITRPLLERELRACLASRANVSIEQGVQVSGLEGSAWRITGVRATSGDGSSRVIEADLVVDASGRGVTLPSWLSRFGLPEPEQDVVYMQLTYTSCLIRRRSQQLGGQLGFVCTPSAPVRRGGAAVAVEGERFLVTLMGYLGERAPRTFEGMVEYARTLPVPGLYELLRDAEPLSEPVEMRDPASVRPRYERLKHWPEGLLPFGDALCSINPSYGHGMTLAALEAHALSHALAPGPRGVAARFFDEVTPLIDVPWALVAGADFEFEGMEGSGARPPLAVRNYFKRALRVALLQREVALAVYRVMHLIDPPSVLFSPPVMSAVMAADPELDASLMVMPEGEGTR